MRNNIKAMMMAAAAILSVSCLKEEVFTVNSRVPHLMEFRQREIPEDFEIGASRPASAEPVDLGLSVMWSNMNLGATSTDQYGEHFAWGEIAPSHDYGWHNYEFNDFHADDEYSLYINKYCFDRYGERQDLDRGGVTLDMYDDAAYMQWGEGWRMPTDEEITELSEKCTWTYSTERMTFTVTGPNGNSIVIPFEGVGIGKGVYVDGGPAIPAGFWTSTLSENESPYAVQLVLEGLPEDEFNKGVSRDGSNRCFGCYIRPVYVKPAVDGKEKETPQVAEVWGSWKLSGLNIQSGVPLQYEGSVSESGERLIEIGIPTNGHDETLFTVDENIRCLFSDGTVRSLLHSTHPMGVMPGDYDECEYVVPGTDFRYSIVWKSL